MGMPEVKEMVDAKRQLEQQELLESLQGILEMPMVVLSFIMLILFIVEASVRLSPSWARIVNLAEWFIWATFILEFSVKFIIAPNKLNFLESNWLMVLSLVLPALRVFRIFRAARAFRSISALRVITLQNRAIAKLSILFKKRKLQYLLLVVMVITILSGTGMFYIERTAPNSSINTFGDGIWWAAGTITTVGTEVYPVTAEGRVLAVLIMTFGMSVFGYVAASLASLFVQSDQSDQEEEQTACGPGATEEIPKLMQQIDELQKRISVLTRTVQGEKSERRFPRG